MEPYITLQYSSEFEFTITPDSVELAGEGDALFDGLFFELVVEIRKLLCEYADEDPTIEGFRIPHEKIVSDSS